MRDPQCFAGGKHVRGCAKVTIVLARGRTLLNHIKVSQHIPLRPLVDHRDFHGSPCADATTEGWRDAPELQHKILPALQNDVGGIVKPPSIVSDPAIKCLSHKVFRHILSITPVRKVYPHLEGQTGNTIVQLPSHRTRLLHKHFGSPSREIVLP